MDQIDLSDMRKKLHSYKKTGLKQVLSILTVIEDPKIDKKALADSKIHKTVRTLATMDLVGDAQMNDQELSQIKAKANETLDKLKRNEKPVQQEKLTLISVTPERKPSVDEQAKSKPVMQVDTLATLGLPANFDQTRLKVINSLIEKFVTPKINRHEATKFCLKLENQFEKKDKQYQSAIKEVFKYIQNDKDESVRNRMLSGLIDIQTASLLKSEDWTSSNRLAVAGSIGRDILSANDMNHNKLLAQEINKDVALGQCNNCGQKKLKLINEIQVRASDEPSTKFYECLNCGVSETTNG